MQAKVKSVWPPNYYLKLLPRSGVHGTRSSETELSWDEDGTRTRLIKDEDKMGSPIGDELRNGTRTGLLFFPIFGDEDRAMTRILRPFHVSLNSITSMWILRVLAV